MKPQDEDGRAVVEWNAEERRALAALDREVEPAPSLEERTVARLRSEGLIGAGGRRRRWTLPRALAPARLGWAAAAAALAAAVFFAGVAVGERWAVSSTAGALAAYHEDALARASARVQQTGSAYVAALAALGRLAAAADPQEVSQGREAALAALYAAASQLVRLDPDDPVAARILQGLDDRQAGAGTTAAEGGAAKEKPGEERKEERQVMWF